MKFTAFETEVLSKLERMAVAMEAVANQSKQQPEQTVKSGPKVSKQSEAIVWAMTTNTTSPSLIAAKFGVTTRTVQRWSELRRLLDNMKQASGGRGPSSGFRTAGGGVEAFQQADDQ